MPIARASSMVLKNPRVAGALSGLWPKAAGMLKGPVNYMGQNPGRTQAALGALTNFVYNFSHQFLNHLLYDEVSIRH